MKLLSCPSCDRALIVDVAASTLIAVILHEPFVTHAGNAVDDVGMSPACPWWGHHGEEWLAGVITGALDPTVAV